MSNTYEPRMATIVATHAIGPKEKWFRLRMNEGVLDPGEFIAVCLAGIGEAPISLCSAGDDVSEFEIAVRRIDPAGMPPHDSALKTLRNVTTALHDLGVGDEVGIRGAFGTQFPVRELHGRDIAVVVGGIGLFPGLRPLREIAKERKEFGTVSLLFGTNTEEERYFPDEIEAWRDEGTFIVREAIARPSATWTGTKGFVTGLIPALGERDVKNLTVYIVGPGVMFKPVIAELEKLGVPTDQIYLSLERKMCCCAGHCGHCRINSVLVCTDGPVFTLADIEKRNLWEALK
jgi:sulfhydrogenase subunit gamma (sulfur reductase)